MTVTDQVAERYAQIAGFAREIAGRLYDEIEKLGFDLGTVCLHSPDDAIYRLQRDPSNGEQSLVGEWRDERGIKQGSLVFHADGSFFVEQDVAQPHPGKARWFVEAVNAWGRDGQIRAEARLLPMPE